MYVSKLFITGFKCNKIYDWVKEEEKRSRKGLNSGVTVHFLFSECAKI